MIHKKQNNQKNIPEHSASALDKSIEGLSPEICERLEAARKIALASTPNSQSNPKPTNKVYTWFKNLDATILKPLSTGLAFSFCLAVFWAILPSDTSQKTPNMASSPDLSAFILFNTLDETERDIIEDIEFAYWLAQELGTEDHFDTQPSDTNRNG